MACKYRAICQLSCSQKYCQLRYLYAQKLNCIVFKNENRHSHAEFSNTTVIFKIGWNLDAEGLGLNLEPTFSSKNFRSKFFEIGRRRIKNVSSFLRTSSRWLTRATPKSRGWWSSRSTWSSATSRTGPSSPSGSTRTSIPGWKAASSASTSTWTSSWTTPASATSRTGPGRRWQINPLPLDKVLEVVKFSDFFLGLDSPTLRLTRYTVDHCQYLLTTTCDLFLVGEEARDWPSCFRCLGHHHIRDAVCVRLYEKWILFRLPRFLEFQRLSLIDQRPEMVATLDKSQSASYRASIKGGRVLFEASCGTIEQSLPHWHYDHFKFFKKPNLT